MMRYIRPVETALAQNRCVTISVTAGEMMTLEADNWRIPVVPGLPVVIRYVMPKAGAPKMSDWFKQLARLAEEHEKVQLADLGIGDE